MGNAAHPQQPPPSSPLPSRKRQQRAPTFRSAPAQKTPGTVLRTTTQRVVRSWATVCRHSRSSCARNRRGREVWRVLSSCGCGAAPACLRNQKQINAGTAGLVKAQNRLWRAERGKGPLLPPPASHRSRTRRNCLPMELRASGLHRQGSRSVQVHCMLVQRWLRGCRVTDRGQQERRACTRRGQRDAHRHRHPCRAEGSRLACTWTAKRRPRSRHQAAPARPAWQEERRGPRDEHGTSARAPRQAAATAAAGSAVAFQPRHLQRVAEVRRAATKPSGQAGRRHGPGQRRGLPQAHGHR